MVRESLNTVSTSLPPSPTTFVLGTFLEGQITPIITSLTDSKLRALELNYEIKGKFVADVDEKYYVLQTQNTTITHHYGSKTKKICGGDRKP